jgi:hypothetical protein
MSLRLSAFVLSPALFLAACAEPAPPADAPEATGPETPSVIAQLPEFDGRVERLRAAQAAAAATGWSLPPVGEVDLSGRWRFETSAGERGEVAFAPGGRLDFGRALEAETLDRWVRLEPEGDPSLPTLIGLGRGEAMTWFAPFSRGTERVLVNVNDRDAWLRLQRV